jgi:hypothetical protein
LKKFPILIVTWLNTVLIECVRYGDFRSILKLSLLLTIVCIDLVINRLCVGIGRIGFIWLILDIVI